MALKRELEELVREQEVEITSLRLQNDDLRSENARAVELASRMRIEVEALRADKH